MGYTKRLLALLALLNAADMLQDRTYAEMFAGDEAWSSGMKLLGYKGISMDARKDADHDFLRPVGFLFALWSIMSLHRDGVFLAAPPCSTWVFMSRFSTGRHLDIMGNDSPYIQAQNALVARLVYVLVLCIMRGVWWIVEQPGSSVLFMHPRWKWLVRHYGHLMKTVKLDMGVFNLRFIKDTVLVGTAPYLENMGRRLSRDDRLAVRDNGHRVATTTDFTDSTGRKRTNGNHEQLKPTQAYDMGFGCQHALEYQAWMAAHPSSDDGLLATPDDQDSEIGGDDMYLRDFDDDEFKWYSNIKTEHKVKLARFREHSGRAPVTSTGHSSSGSCTVRLSSGGYKPHQG